MTTTPTDEEKARPTVHLRNQDYTLSLQNHRRGERWFIDTTDELAEVGAAVLQALDSATRARVLEPFLPEVMVRLERLAERVAVRHDDDLSVARAEVERLKTFLRASVPTTRTSPHEPFLVCIGCGATDGEDCATACWVYELEGLVAEPEPKEPTT